MSEHPEHQSKQERIEPMARQIICPKENTFTRQLKLIDAALSDVTEQKDLGDGPEPLGQTREETDHHSGGLR